MSDLVRRDDLDDDPWRGDPLDEEAVSLPEDFLYDLLPAFLRNRDYYQGQPLRALMEALESEYGRMRAAVAALYEDWFIETCSEPAVAAIGELLALGGQGRPPEGFHPRALVGNAIACRRRKGVPAALERVIRDASGWYARVTELSRQLVASRSLEAPRPGGGTVDVRDERALVTLGTAFEAVPRIAAVRRDGAERGDPAPVESPGPGFNLVDLGVYVWRLQAYPLSGVTARRAAPGRYRFHPLGIDTPLFNLPRTGDRPDDPARIDNLPAALRPEVLAEEIEALRAGAQRPEGFFGRQPALWIADPETGRPIPPEAMELADLGSWTRPAAGAPSPQGTRQPVQVAIDPARGRFAFPAGRGETGEVAVGFCYGFPSDLGGGPYPAGAAPAPNDAAEWQAEVGAEGDFPTLAAALEAWAAAEVGSGRLRLAGGRSEEPAAPPAIDLRGGRRLSIEVAEPGPAVFLGDLSAIADEVAAGSLLALSGLWLGGRLEAAGHLEIRLAHCTLAPPAAAQGAAAAAAAPRPSLLLHGPVAEVSIAASILGPIDPGTAEVRLRLSGSILDGAGGPALAAGGKGGRLELHAARSTVLGRLDCTRLERAEAVLFAEPVTVAETAEGELRYSWVAPGSRTPYRFRCQPEPPGAAGPPAPAAEAAGPVFVSRRFGAPGYAQLDARTPRTVRAGSETGSEIGAFESLYQPLREAALAAVLAEYLPWGLEPRVVYVT